MTNVAYVDGRYVHRNDPAIHIEDRGYQFADGVYEVMKVVDGRFCAMDRHFERLQRSLEHMKIAMPMSRQALTQVLKETWRRNATPEATVYLQISRGVAPRNHMWAENLKPSLVVTVQRAKFPTAEEMENGVKVVTMPDERWAQCHIKSISLLPNVLAKQEAKAAGAREAWLVDEEGMVTEGGSSNAYIVDGEGRLVTRPLGPEILGGVTRAVVLEVARDVGVEVVERPFSVDEAHRAREAFMTSTSSLVLPITQIDDRTVANGKPGSTCLRLADLYRQREGLPLPA